MKRLGPYLLTALLLAGLAGCASSKIIVPPISENAAGIRTPGKFVWFDLFTTDMTAATNFYENLFGWDMDRTNDDDPSVKTIRYKGRPLANMIGREAEPGDSQWLSYLSIGNVDTALEIVEHNGGSTHRSARDLPDRGRVGVALDPWNAPFALVDSSSGDPIDAGPMPNRFIGAELWTTDVNGAIGFYSSLAGYETRDVDVHEKVTYKLLLRNGKPRAGVVSIPWDGVKPQWIPYIGVSKILATLIKAQTLGGTVLVGPDMASKTGRVAIVRDPSGAVFGLQQLD